MQQQGYVTNVLMVDAGGEAAEDSLIGSTTINLVDGYDFNEGGGSFTIDDGDDVYSYLSVDMSNDTMTLAAPLDVDITQDTPILVYPRGQQKIAMVQLDDDDEGVRAIIPYSMTDRFDDGIRDVEDMESVFIDDESGRWEVTAVDEQIPSIDGGYFDPGTLPEPAPPVNPPPPVQVTVEGMATALMARTENIHASTEIRYYISTVDGFTPSPAELVATTSSIINVITALPDGSPLLPEVDYYVVVIATNAAGDAAPSAQAVGQLDLTVPTDYIMGEVVAGFVLTGSIQVGGDNLTIDAEDGIRINQADGGIIHFPRDGSAAKITAELVARSLIVENGADIFGESLLAGEIRIGASIEDPTEAPDVTFGYQTISDVSHLVSGLSLSGVCRNVADDGWVVIGNTTTGVVKRILIPDVVSTISVTTIPTAFDSRGIVKLGSSYYILRQISGGDISLIQYSSSWVFTNVAYIPTSGDPDYWPALGTDGTDLKVAYYSTFGNLAVATFDTSLAAVGSPYALDSTPSAFGHLSGYYEGSADFGSSRRVVTHHTLEPRVYSAVDAEEPDEDWTRYTSNIRGLCWDGTNFFMLTNLGRIQRLSQHVVRSVLSVGYAWETDTGTYRTDLSPLTALWREPRTYATVTGDPAPQAGSADVNAADTVAIYGVQGGGTMYLQDALPVGIKGMVLDILVASGTVAPTVNGFTAISTPGAIISSVADADGPIIDLGGGGPGRVGDLTWDADGDTGWLGEPNALTIGAGDVVASTGWTVQSGQYVQFGPIIALDLEVTRTGADMGPLSSGGNLSPDISICTGIPAAIRPTTQNAIGTLKRGGVQTGFCELTPAGVISFTDGMPSATYAGSSTAYKIRMVYCLGM